MKKHKSSESLRKINNKFEELFRLYLELEKTPRRYGTDETLTSKEIHLIEVIGDNDETLSVTDLARYSNVTKGAISQSLKKLEKKGLTTKEEDPQNSSRSIVMLSSNGKAAYFSHKHWHETMDGGYLSYLTGLEDEKIEFLMEFMSRVEAFLKSVIDSDR
ncbi:MAG: winged helix-turn-helix transcriptional regulator [Deltaproteobacteria bacterium]|jgi:DNA-binding MarR family transcriptional regulator|nr:winged helix-turn-helix transcriptional regulator [Deltaproteobacteria bacterium]MBT4086895.1 winged helix-turn-helix transcriptional regulator [Deltaproteobacteria bacterium]MBT4265845.1 winged helix-turn-helix transcriptional regulator [Deltaproteobacteria bacterium]MBT4642846.1 winged helix-turn-helix transcriptional regulator [Deltaproteobacteria bacterium]MBT6504140.1 winged helix-turn-helix transcriptional regulator [Deltaproteobacteria bacterium]